MVEVYSLWSIENTNISVHSLLSRVKVMGNKDEDTGTMGVTSKKNNIFSQKNVTFLKQKDRHNVCQINHTTFILK